VKVISSIYEFDDVQVHPDEFRVLKAGKVVALEPKAFEVLRYLVEHPNQLVGKDELLDAVWKDTFVTQNAMTRVIAQIRKALNDDAKESRYIETVPTRGYRFIAKVEKVAAEPPAIEVPGALEEHRIPPSKARIGVGKTILLSLLILLAAAGLARLFTRTARDDSAPHRFLPVQFSSSKGLDAGASFSPDGNLIAYASDRSGSFEIYVKAFDSRAKELQLTNDGNQNLSPSFSPDGRSIVFASWGRPGIFRVPATGGTLQRLTDFGLQPVWSPDGQTIVFTTNDKASLSVTDYYYPSPSALWIVSASGGPPKQITGDGKFDGQASAPSWSPDGKEIRFVNEYRGESSVWTYRADNGSFRKLFGSSIFQYSNATFSSDGSHMWFVRWRLNGDIGIWQIDLNPATLQPRGDPQPLYQSSFGVPRDLAISRDGKKLAFTAVVSTSQIVVHPIEAGGSKSDGVPLVNDVTYRYALLRTSSDGSHVAYVSFPRNGPSQLYVVDADGAKPSIAIGSAAEAQNFASFSSDGNRVFFVAFSQKNGTIRSWNLTDGAVSNFSGIPVGTNQLIFSPDGKTAAFHDDRDDRRRVYFQDVATGARQIVASGKEDVGYPRFSRDGKWVSVEVSHENGGNDIAVLPATGGPMEVIVRSTQPSFAAGWMPDNDRILFAGFRDAVWNVYSVSRATRKVERLTDYKLTRTYVRYPDWLAGNRVAYEFNETKGNVFVANLP
jgi:Tol biopolymer transport system component/DNA-binding winged helix-turn-helix (wHTH) protein